MMRAAVRWKGTPDECACETNEAGDIRCHQCGQRVNVCCWRCKTLRGFGPCPANLPTGHVYARTDVGDWVAAELLD